MTYEEPGVIGRYLREYKPQITTHRLTNHLFANPPRQMLFPSATVAQQKKIPDVSFYQGEINFYDMRQKTDAIIIRAGQNLWKDSQFDRNWLEAKRHGIKRGSYWFYDDRIDPGKQADLWVSLLKDDMPEMEIWADWENSYGGAFGGLRNVVAFMQAMEARLPGTRIGLYTGYYFFRDHSNAVTNAAQYNYLKSRPLWLAWYTDNAASVLIPNPWSSIFIWQFGTPAVGREYGVATAEIDMNYINMTEADFQRRYGATSPPEPEPPTQPGETMSQWYRVTATAGLNVRDGAGTSYRDIGDLYPNDKIEVQGTPVNGWLHIVRLLRVGHTVPIAFDGWCSGAYCVAIAAPVVTVPPEAPADNPPISGTIELVMRDGTKQTYSIGQFTKVG